MSDEVYWRKSVHGSKSSRLFFLVQITLFGICDSLIRAPSARGTGQRSFHFCIHRLTESRSRRIQTIWVIFVFVMVFDVFYSRCQWEFANRCNSNWTFSCELFANSMKKLPHSLCSHSIRGGSIFTLFFYFCFVFANWWLSQSRSFSVRRNLSLQTVDIHFAIVRCKNIWK